MNTPHTHTYKDILLVEVRICQLHFLLRSKILPPKMGVLHMIANSIQ